MRLPYVGLLVAICAIGCGSAEAPPSAAGIPDTQAEVSGVATAEAAEASAQTKPNVVREAARCPRFRAGAWTASA